IMRRFLLTLLFLLAVLQVTVQVSVDKRGAAWFLRPNWRLPAKRFFYPETATVAMDTPNEFDQYIIY
uniref:Uncharacterized protein n=1 Tax=Caenorhabditis japonica TaxID=281687 RepID=A0A8R1E1I4_CAEJA